MRLRFGAAVCLFLAFWGAGCRKAIAPNLDNQAPETWIVAAPQDTITTRDPLNQPIPPSISRIPVRYHLYWAGSDRDGAVAGYFFAIVETLPVPEPGASSVPSLPGPKARDYHFTTKTDSIFIFHASEEVSERRHAFFIFAVDNKGKADPTPARFIFDAYDRFPPLAIIDELKAVGTVYDLLPGGAGVSPSQKTFLVRDSFEISDTHFAPRDTVPANALLTMRWHGEPTIPSTIITGYRYKLDEPDFNTVDSSVHTATYNTGVGLDRINPGQKIFTLRAIGQSGWRGESTRWFQMNFAPDTWFAGPDPNDPLAGWRVIQDGNGKRYWFIDLSLTGWPGTQGNVFPGVPGTQMSHDSTVVLPASRTERKSFFEIYNDRLWLKQEGDTVDMNSWVVFPSGGFDRDSPYRVKVNTVLTGNGAPPGVVTVPTGPNGSPIGFRIRVQVKGGTDPTNRASQPTETTTYPVFDPASVFHQPAMNGYWGLTTAGKAYAVVRAEDGDGTIDRRIDQRPGDAVGVADRVDAAPNPSLADPADAVLRSKILTFYVDKAPVLQTNDANFKPKPNTASATLTSGPNGTPVAQNLWALLATDVDQYDPNRGTDNKVGGTPPYSPILRRKLAFTGKFVGNPTKDTCYVLPGDFLQAGNPGFAIPPIFAPGNLTLRVRLCDCNQCDDLRWPSSCGFVQPEAAPGEGRCVETAITLRLNAPANITEAGASPGPGSPSSPGRRQP
jgi:hypothetical protein